ncbi:PaaX family transcriptional regulator [Leifsonia shinshuensis]|uniref:Phenylacetic acid degradation operon negative regulatory protein n=1 Tax=Leifsonia shinshuensis TaxID=150026 RepID=A0A853CNL0_9MICO|nr:PaaX family transcriptional regulator C-terminal domain-containing protein [Leifsonia shinshuensis]NYJ22436.1 phenylacetic acid degradation operon negative regulatory protein [Leifsonia shinshuensis]
MSAPVEERATEPGREDLEARSGSATAVLRTVVGSTLRPIGGWMSAAGAVELMAALGVPAATARSSLARLCARGVLVRQPRDGTAGYALDPAAVPMLERGDARIFGERTAPASWCLVSFSFPEHQRSQRHRLRRTLAALGCGTVADGLWIGPAALEPELADVARAFGADLFTGARPAADLADGLPRWYDLDAIGALHTAFLDRFGSVRAPTDDREAFALWIRLLDEWRVIPYRDPGLPAAALPADWPGGASAALFARLHAELAGRALAFAAETARADRAPSAPR